MLSRLLRLLHLIGTLVFVFVAVLLFVVMVACIYACLVVLDALSW